MGTIGLLEFILYIFLKTTAVVAKEAATSLSANGCLPYQLKKAHTARGRKENLGPRAFQILPKEILP